MEERFVFFEYTTLLISIEIENLIYTTVSSDKSSVNGRIRIVFAERAYSTRANGARLFQLSSEKFLTYNRREKAQHCILYRTRSFHESRSCKFFRTFPPFLFFAFSVQRHF